MAVSGKIARLSGGLLVLAGILLHAGIALFQNDSATTAFSLGLFAWACTPYVVCAVVLRKHPIVAITGVIAILVIDIYVFFTEVVPAEPDSPALELLFAPFWNLILYMPAGMLIGRWIHKKCSTTSEQPVT